MPDAEPFDAFMRRALFDPRHGYYSRNISTVGARGDFSTSASTSELPGRAIARWLLTESKALPDVSTIIEVGGGDGTLLETVRKHIGWFKRRRFEFCMVETSAPLREKQRKRLGSGVRWFDHLSQALDACEGAAFIYHNELLDALPVAVVEWDAVACAWKEVWLETRSGSSPVEELRPLRHTDPFAASFSVLREWISGSQCKTQRCELHLGVRAWLDEWAAHWKRGSMLTIDYGDQFPALYHRRPRGTLRAYLLHQRLEGADVYQNAGRQDITTDINFTDLRLWLTSMGCVEQFYMMQRDFIISQPGPRARARSAADRFIIHPEGAGSAFKCLGVRLPPR